MAGGLRLLLRPPWAAHGAAGAECAQEAEALLPFLLVPRHRPEAPGRPGPRWLVGLSHALPTDKQPKIGATLRR